MMVMFFGVEFEKMRDRVHSRDALPLTRLYRYWEKNGWYLLNSPKGSISTLNPWQISVVS
jgi:hypothetical protein